MACRATRWNSRSCRWSSHGSRIAMFWLPSASLPAALEFAASIDRGLAESREATLPVPINQSRNALASRVRCRVPRPTRPRSAWMPCGCELQSRAQRDLPGGAGVQQQQRGQAVKIAARTCSTPVPDRLWRVRDDVDICSEARHDLSETDFTHLTSKVRTSLPIARLKGLVGYSGSRARQPDSDHSAVRPQRCRRLYLRLPWQRPTRRCSPTATLT